MGELVCEMADFRALAAAEFAAVAAEQAAFGWHAFAAAFEVTGQVLVDGTAGEGAVATAQVAVAEGWSFGGGLWEPGWHSYAAHTRSDRSDVGCIHAAMIDRCAAAWSGRTKRIRFAPLRFVVELPALPDTSSDPLGDNAVKRVAAVAGAAVAAVVAVESVAEADLTIRSPAVASCRSSSLAVWGTEALMCPAEGSRSCAADSWWAFDAGLAAVPVDARSPWEQRTDWPAVAEAVARPTDCPPCHPWRRYDPASNTYCPSWLADRQGTETAVAAAASGVAPDVWHMVHRRYLAAPCHEGQSDRIDSRRPLFGL